MLVLTDMMHTLGSGASISANFQSGQLGMRASNYGGTADMHHITPHILKTARARQFLFDGRQLLADICSRSNTCTVGMSVSLPTSYERTNIISGKHIVANNEGSFDRCY